jgi:hypothetical protein
MYHPAYGKEFRPKKVRTNQLHAHETAINLRFQRYPDGPVFEDTRPDWLREQQEQKTATRIRPDSPSRLGQWELEWVPHHQKGQADQNDQDPSNTQKSVWLKGKLVLPKRPLANTVGSLLSTSVRPLHPMPYATEIGHGIYFGEEIRPATRPAWPGASQSKNSVNKAARAPPAGRQHVRADAAQELEPVAFPAQLTRPFSALEKPTQKDGLWNEPFRDTNQDAAFADSMSLAGSQRGSMRPFTASLAGKRGGSHASAMNSSVATSTIVQRLK